MARVLSLCRCFGEEDTEGAQLTSVQYTECVPRLYAVGGVLECVCLRWATTDGRENESEIAGSVKENDCTVARE